MDKILEDIKSAVEEGYFDKRREEGPSELEKLSVEELQKRVALMSPGVRREYLAKIGRFRK